MLKWLKTLGIVALIGTITLFTVSPAEAAVPSQNPKSVIDQAPNDGGEWWGPNSWGNPSVTGDTVTRATSRAGVVSALVGGIPGLTASIVGGSGGIAAAIYALGTDTTYFYQYDYVESSPDDATLQTATVTYYYEESTRYPKDFIGSTVHYGSMTE